ncbi:hypothetical protein SK128_021184, partial [Halocaridina rubra]
TAALVVRISGSVIISRHVGSVEAVSGTRLNLFRVDLEADKECSLCKMRKKAEDGVG